MATSLILDTIRDCIWKGDMKTFIFADPSYLWFLFLIPILIGLFLMMFYWRRKKFLKFVHSERMETLVPKFSFLRKLMRYTFALLSIMFLILAWSRPQRLNQKVLKKSKGLEIILMVDVSQSMLVSDVSPNRLYVMKSQLNRFVESSRGRHRIGLIAFAGSAFFISPLTQDLNLIQNYLTTLSVDIVSHQGTNFKSALTRVEKAFQGGSLNKEEIARVLIIASDGEDHEVGALEKVRLLSEQGIHIFTLGFGTKEGGLVPLSTDASKENYQKNAQGQVVRSQFKSRILKEFAKIGKGVFYHVTSSSSNVVEQLQQDLDRFQQISFKTKNSLQHQELYMYFLMVSLFFFFLYLGMSETRSVKT